MNREHLAIIQSGSAGIERFRRDNPDVTMDLSGADCAHLNLSSLRLSKVDFTGAELLGSDFSGAELEGCVFVNANLREAKFAGTTIDLCNFANCDLSYAAMDHAKCTRVNFSGGRLVHTGLSNSFLAECTFSISDLENVRLVKARVVDCSFRSANLRRLSGIGVNLFRCRLADSNLTGALLSSSKFSDCKFTGANLSKVDGSHSIFEDCCFRNATLLGSLLVDADLRRSVFSNADLQGSSLVRSDCAKAVFSGAALQGCDFGFCVMNGVDLRNVRCDCLSRFSQLRGFSGMVIERETVEYVFRGELDRGAAMLDMVVVDDLATLRAGFTGPRGVVYWLGLLCFVLPPVVFLLGLLTVEAFDAGYASEVVNEYSGPAFWGAGPSGSGVPLPPQVRMTVLEALGRFLVIGWRGWKGEWSVHYGFWLFCLSCGYRVASFILLWHATSLINEQKNRGTPVKFSFQEEMKFHFPLWGQISLGSFGAWHRFNIIGSICAALIALEAILRGLLSVVVIR